MSALMRRTRIEHILSALPPLATEERTFGIGSSVPNAAVSERVHITLRQKQRVEQKHHGIMDIYEVEFCRRGRWEQQDARFVAAVPTKPHTRWPGSICTSKVNAGRLGYASEGLGTEAHRRSCFTPPEATG
jgi:hypothetical protein